MTPNQKGDIAELAVALALRKNGYVVSIPFGDAEYDLLIDDGESLHKVQCKHASKRGDIIAFGTEGVHRDGTRIPYKNIDYFGVYSSDLDKAYLVPFEITAKGSTTLRLAPTKNGQTKGIRFASDYEV